MSDKKREEEARAKAKADAEAKALSDAAEKEAKARADAAAAMAGKKTAVTVRHKTPHERYRCAGFGLSKKARAIEATPEQLERLRRDPWVVIVADAEPKE